MNVPAGLQLLGDHGPACGDRERITKLDPQIREGIQRAVQSQVPDAIPRSDSDDHLSLDKGHQALAILNPRDTVALLFQNPDRELEGLEIAAEFARRNYHGSRVDTRVVSELPVSRQRVFGSRQEASVDFSTAG
jgi:hypothetical protein